MQFNQTNTFSVWFLSLFILLILTGHLCKFSNRLSHGVVCLFRFRRFLKIQYVIAIHLMKWLANFYDFRFKWTATAAIGIHPLKVWLSQLVIFKNAIWMWGQFRRTICNKILFYTWKKWNRNVWNTSDYFWPILHESSISFWVA